MTIAVMSSPANCASAFASMQPVAGSYGSASSFRPWPSVITSATRAPGRVDGRRHQDARRLRAPVRAHGHEAGLGERGRAVVERGVRHVHRGQAGDHGLELVHDLQRALARLGLVRRVGAVDLAARDERPDRRGDVVLVGARADEVERQAVAPPRARRRAGRRPFQAVPAGTPGSASMRSAGGISSNRSSMLPAPMRSSIARTSSGVCGM